MKLRIRQISESEFTVKGHGVHTAFTETIESLRKLPDTEVLVNQRGKVDITHIHTVGVYSLVYMLFGSGKKVVSAHVVPNSFVGSLVGAKYWLPLSKIYLKWFYNRADLVLAVSDETKRQLQAIGVNKPIEIVYNTIDTNRYHTTKEGKRTAKQNLGLGDSWVVVCVGQVQPRKRVDDFIAVAKAMPDCTFIWVGGMPFSNLAAEHVKMQEIMDNPPSNVRFTGVIPFEQVAQYYQASDLFFLPSEQETFGLVVVEAAAAGLPILLRDIPDYNETFKGDALLVQPDKYVETINKLKADQAFYDQIAQHSYKIAQRYDSAAGAENLKKLYGQLLK